MRYTAATCDPADFVSRNYTLRQALMGRSTELFIVMVSFYFYIFEFDKGVSTMSHTNCHNLQTMYNVR